MGDQFKNLMIGLFVTAAAVIVVFVLMFLHPNIGDKGKTIHVLFTDVDKITVGTRVTYAGKPVGEVIAIDEVPNAFAGKTDASGQLYVYDLTLLVDSKLKIYNTDEILPRTSGLLGEKNVEITPYAPKPGQKLEQLDDQKIYATETGSVEDTLKILKGVANRVDLALEAATGILNNVQKNKLVDKITKTVEHVKSIAKALDKPDEWSSIIDHLDSLTKDFDDLMKKANGSWGNIDEAILAIRDASVSAKKLMNNGATIVDSIAKGEGSFGKLIEGDDFYLRLTSILSKAETMMDDINHYGLLFQTDKGWQRLRARRMNLLQKLESPQEFRNYFNDEVNEISTALSRVYLVLDAVESNPCCCNLMEDREFRKVFAELMRRVKMLDEEVRMYNTQAMETEVHRTELGDVFYPCNPCMSCPMSYPMSYPCWSE